jgi:sugar-specific transcriptional regulator TrmB
MKYDKKIAEKLTKNGLHEREAKILTYLYESGGGFPSRIAKECGINRSTTYKALTKLSVQSLVSEVEKENKAYYKPKKPKQLIKQKKRDVRQAQKSVNDIKKILPDLEGIYSADPSKPTVRYFSGKKEVVEVYMDHIDVKTAYEMVAWANAPSLKEFLPEDKFNHYVKTKEAIGITTRGIIPNSAAEEDFTESIYEGIKKDIWPEMRYIPDDMFPYEGEVTVYGQNRISIVNLKEDQHVGVIMEDKTIHDMMQLAFELSWVGADHVEEIDT